MKVAVYVKQDELIGLIEESTKGEEVYEYLNCSFEKTSIFTQKLTVDIKRVEKEPFLDLRVLYWTK